MGEGEGLSFGLGEELGDADGLGEVLGFGEPSGLGFALVAFSCACFWSSASCLL